MLTKLFQVLFVPKRARAKLAAVKTAAPGKASREAREAPAAQAAQAAGAAREQLLDDAMALYRQQRRDVYDTLDDETKRQIEADAEKAFGKLLHTKG